MWRFTFTGSKSPHFHLSLFYHSFHSSIWRNSKPPILITNTSHPIHTIITLLSLQHHPHPSFTSIPYTLLSREWGRVECSIKQTSSHMSISLTPLVDCLMEHTHPSQTLYHLYHSTTTAFTGIRISLTSLFSYQTISLYSTYRIDCSDMTRCWSEDGMCCLWWNHSSGLVSMKWRVVLWLSLFLSLSHWSVCVYMIISLICDSANGLRYCGSVSVSE